MNIYYFTADWCRSCQTFKPTVQSVSQQKGVHVNYVNIDYETTLVEQYNITSVPTLMIVDNSGNVVFRNSGVMSAPQLTEIFSKYK